MPTSTVLQEYRCYLSGRLLFKASGDIQIEIMNPVNRIMNYAGPTRLEQDIGLKGTDFGSKCVQLNCQKCTRLLAKAIGVDGVAEIKCRYCKITSFFDLEKLQRSGMNTRSNAAKKLFRDSRNVNTEMNKVNLKLIQEERKEEEKIDAKIASSGFQKAKVWGPGRFKTVAS